MRRRTDSPLWKPSLEDEVRSELDFHLEMRVRDLMAEGLDEAEARERARSSLGDVDSLAERCLRLAAARDRKRGLSDVASDLAHDLRLAARVVGRGGSSLLAAVLAMAVGIGAVVAVFSAVYAVLIEPLPLPAAHRLVAVQTADRATGAAQNLVAPISFAAWRDAEVFENVAVYMGDGFTVLVDDTPRRAFGLEVSPAFLDVLGLRMLEGRRLRPEDFRPGAPGVAVLTPRMARSLFGSSRDALGQQLSVDGEERAVVGVLSADVEVLEQDLDVVLPFQWDSRGEMVQAGYLFAVARLAEGTTRASAQAALQPHQDRVDQTLGVKGRDVALMPFREVLVGDGGRRLVLLLGAVALVLVIACGNVANLLLARGLERRRELGVRTALGATRARLVRQLLVESLLVVLAAAALGLVLAGSLLRLFVAGAPESVLGLDQASINVPVLLFTLALALVATLVAGVLPALRAARVAESTVSGRSAMARSGRLRPLLIVGQVALTLTLLLAAGGLIRGALLESRIDPGFEAQSLVSAQLSLPTARYPSHARLVAAYQDLLVEVESLPGVESAGLGNRIPLAGPSLGVEYAAKERPQDGVLAALRIVSPGLFATLRVPLVAGRGFDSRSSGAAYEVIVNESFARRVWGDESPVGRLLISENRSLLDEDGDHLDLEVVGVVGDVRSDGLRAEAPPEVYFEMSRAPQEPWSWAGNSMMLVTRSDLEADTLVPQLRSVVTRVDKALPLFNVDSMDGRLSRAAAVARFNTLLFSILGLAALLLACAGVYSLTSFVVSQQEYEMGVRLALGSTAQQLIQRIAWRAMLPVVVGVVLGLALGATLESLLQAGVFGAPTTDVWVTLVGACVVVLAALVSVLLPARRATEVDPARVLSVQ